MYYDNEPILRDIVATQSTDHYNKKDLEKFAKEHNLRIVYPSDNQLQVDIDCEADFLVFKQHFQIFIEQEQFQNAHFHSAPSRNKPEGKHIIITVPGFKFTPLQRIAYQSVLGSDRKRELLCLFDLLHDNTKTTLFFEKCNTY